MARRRRNLKDLLTPDPTPDKQLAHPSGWCMTMSHEFCPYQFSHGKCGCDCHTKPKPVSKRTKAVSDDSKTQKTQKSPKAVVPIADTPKKRGRPKKPEGITPTAIIVDEVTDYVDPRPWKRNQ